MGFTVLGSGRFLGSGHPDLREAREKGLPPLLGLIESQDGGRSWVPISLLGEAPPSRRSEAARASGLTVQKPPVFCQPPPPRLRQRFRASPAFRVTPKLTLHDRTPKFAGISHWRDP
jgi:hypothetical protein